MRYTWLKFTCTVAKADTIGTKNIVCCSEVSLAQELVVCLLTTFTYMCIYSANNIILKNTGSGVGVRLWHSQYQVSSYYLSA